MESQSAKHLLNRSSVEPVGPMIRGNGNRRSSAQSAVNLDFNGRELIGVHRKLAAKIVNDRRSRVRAC
jgi:hypothetical protein